MLNASASETRLVSHFQTSDGTRITYHEQGHGRPLVFIPGWSMTPAVFDKQLEGLSDECHVIATNLRGMGDTDKNSANNVTLEQWAQDLHELILQRDLKDIVLVGWSMGAFASWTYYDQFVKDRLAALIVVEMVGCLDGGWAEGENAALAQDWTKYMRGFIEGMMEAPSPSDIDFFVAEAQKTPVSIAQHLNCVLESTDLRPVLSTITIPTLIIYGKKLVFFTEEQKQETTHLIRNATTVTLENSGHCPFWEEPERFNEEVRSFVRNLN